MNAADRAALDGTATPVDQYGAVRACVIAAGGGYRTAWCHDGGRRKDAFGAMYTTPRAATATARYLNARSGAGTA